jgi:Tfp pilus assembly protein PilF
MWLLHLIKRQQLPLPWPLSCALLCGLLAGCATLPGSDRAAEPGAGAQQAAAPAAALTLYEQAVSSMAAGDDIEAELRFGEFLLRYPDFPGAHVNMAILKARAGDDLQAEASLERALAIAPQHAAALNQLGMLRRRQGRFMDAEVAYEAAAAADPAYALPHYNLGVLNELYLQRLEAALGHFQKYQELGGDDEQVEKWIVDLERRIAANQRTANVTE